MSESPSFLSILLAALILAAAIGFLWHAIATYRSWRRKDKAFTAAVRPIAIERGNWPAVENFWDHGGATEASRRYILKRISMVSGVTFPASLVDKSFKELPEDCRCWLYYFYYQHTHPGS